jgi:hypothetical protein
MEPIAVPHQLLPANTPALSMAGGAREEEKGALALGKSNNAVILAKALPDYCSLLTRAGPGALH